jgi:putative nucleotidyltransferase with HDIG domain
MGTGTEQAPTESADSEERGERSRRLARMVEAMGELAVLPQVVAKVLELSAEQTPSAADFDRAISVDPGFASRLLKLANSAHYGLPRQVSTIRDAVVLLGIREVRCLAMAATAFELFVGRSDRDSLVRRELWRHAVYTAALARSISRRAAGVDEELAFVAGLLHDVGKSIALEVADSEYLTAMIRAEAEGVPLYEVEQETLPFTHPELGAVAMGKWNLPESLVEAVGRHHEPAGATGAPQLTATVAVADAIARFLVCQEQGGDAGLIEDLDEMSIPPEALAMLEVDPADLFRSVVECAGHLTEAATMYSVAA